MLLAFHSALLGWGAWIHSPGWDEFAHLPAGLSHWELGNFDLYHVNPPLVRMAAALPLLTQGIELDWRWSAENMDRRPEWRMGAQVTERYGAQAFWFFTLARWACIPFSILAALVCFWWGRALYGEAAGLLAAGLWCFSPLVLANAQMITPDAGSAALGAAAGFTLWRWLRGPSAWRAFVAGGVLGLAQLTKFTWIVLFPLWPALWLVYRWSDGRRERRAWCREGLQLTAIMLLALYVINAGYGFEASFRRLGEYRFVSATLSGAEGRFRAVEGAQHNRFAGSRWGAVLVPVPANYLLGIDRQKRDFEGRLWSYLRGEWRRGGWWYYYLYGLAVKEPVGYWVLFVIALGLSVFARGYSAGAPSDVAEIARSRPGSAEYGTGRIGDPCYEEGASGIEVEWGRISDPSYKGAAMERGRIGGPSYRGLGWRDEMVVLAPAVVILVFVSSQTGFNHHLRYVLPAVPFLFIWMAKVARSFELLRAPASRVPALPNEEAPHPGPLPEREGEKRGTAALASPCLPVSSSPCLPRSAAALHATVALLTAAALLWAVASSLYVYPHSHAYFNELVGGPRNGHHHLLNSNIDWGQDLLKFKDWLDRNPHARPIHVACSAVGWLLEPTLREIEVKLPPPGPGQGTEVSGDAAATLGPQPGWYAVFVTALRGRHGRYEYFLHFEPTDMVGYTVYIYHVTLEEANRVRRELGLPELDE